jgi:hypothetical protein
MGALKVRGGGVYFDRLRHERPLVLLLMANTSS